MANGFNDIFQAAIPILCLLITAGGAYLVALLKRETVKIEKQLDNEIVAKYIDMANEAITSSVIYVTQTFVEALKKNQAFDKEKQIEAFNMAKKRTIEILGETTVRALQEIYGDLDAFIDTRIEQICWETKQMAKPIETIE